jgi:hypothetical protein
VVTSDLGGLNEEAMGRAFGSLDRPIQACLDAATGRLSVLGGRFVLKLRIAPDGKPRWAYLSESTLGDREAERCVLDLVRGQDWPKPLGGDGHAERAYEIDARAQPGELEEKWVRPAVAKARTNAWKCRKARQRGKIQVTAYIAGDGRVLAAGLAPPNERIEEAADCIAEAVRKVRFGKVGKRVKMSFEIWW